MTSPPRLDVGALSLRKGERGLLIGGTQTGKSTLADVLRRDFLHRYPTARCLIADTKPRYRAAFLINGMSADKRYKQWGHGPKIAGSVVVDDPSELRHAWRLGFRVAIVQCESKRDIARIVSTVESFMDQSNPKTPQLLHADEVLDFFHGNGMAKGGSDVIDRTARAGSERGTAALYCTQRTYGLSSTILENLERLYAFRVDARKDVKRLQEMGAPDFPMPKNKHEFRYWYKGDYDRVYPPLAQPPYRLELPKGST